MSGGQMFRNDHRTRFATEADGSSNGIPGKGISRERLKIVSLLSLSAVMILVVSAAFPVKASPAAQSGSVILVGAGDIATCTNNDDEATAKLLDNIPGTVFVAGDEAYPSGSAVDFQN